MRVTCILQGFVFPLSLLLLSSLLTAQPTATATVPAPATTPSATNPVADASSPQPGPQSLHDRELLRLLAMISTEENRLAQVERIYGSKHRLVTSSLATIDWLSEKLDEHLKNNPDLRSEAAAAMASPRPGDDEMVDEALLRTMANNDAILRQDLAYRNQLRSVVSQMETLGFGAQYRPLIMAKRGLEICDQRITRYAHAYLRRHPQTTQPSSK